MRLGHAGMWGSVVLVAVMGFVVYHAGRQRSSMEVSSVAMGNGSKH